MKFNFAKNFGKKTKGGYSLLFAVLIGSMLLLIGAAIADLALKSYDISSSTKESQIAFYAADSALECALFYDFQGNQRFFEPYDISLGDFLIDCGSLTNLSVEVKRIDINTVTNVIKEFDVNGACASVVITKTEENPIDRLGVLTNIRASGYNTSCNENGKNIKVERGLEVSY